MLKRLRNIARNIAHKFSVSANHFAYLASSSEYQYAEIDLCSGQIIPVEYNLERNRILVEQCRSNLFCLLRDNEVSEIETVFLTVGFTPAAGATLMGEFTITFTLKNNRRAFGRVNAEVLPQP
ncbi:hypothetical protein [Marinospirillum perlucidum]|uniref:hypothetical protein n=1 Tax=Marinospirillum perlucidum TaxID=1982602 RepID=UPI000DF1521A|nr:hypothetical protein [Marinospirillum perlucidum]